MLNGAQQRLFLISIFITKPGDGLEGILTKFVDARMLGRIASVSEYRIKIQNYLKSCTEKYNSCRNRGKLLSLGGSTLLILWCAFPVGYRLIIGNSEYSHGYD